MHPCLVALLLVQNSVAAVACSVAALREALERFTPLLTCFTTSTKNSVAGVACSVAAHFEARYSSLLALVVQNSVAGVACSVAAHFEAQY